MHLRLPLAFILLSACSTSTPEARIAKTATPPTSEAKLPEGVKSVAVMPMRAKGQADKAVLEVLDDLLLSSFQDLAGHELRVVGKSDIDAMLGFEATRDAAGCSDVSCTAEIAGSLGVDSIVSATVGTLGEKHILTLVWIDQRKAEPLQRLSQPLGTSESTFDVGVRNAVAIMLGMSDRVVALPEGDAAPVVSRDPYKLANGSTTAFHPCTAHEQCQAGNLCVDNGGDRLFYCKPVCNSDPECQRYGYKGMGCRAHTFKGKAYERKVCNEKDSALIETR